MAGVPHPEPLSKTSYSAAELLPDDSAAVLLEQRKLPETEEYLRVEDAEQMARAIRDMVVRGAPAIGIAAAYGMVLAARRASDFRRDMAAAAETLEAARPTAVNLAWAVRRMLARAEGLLVGTSSGACFVAARQLARELGPGRHVAFVCASNGERYLSTTLFR